MNPLFIDEDGNVLSYQSLIAQVGHVKAAKLFKSWEGLLDNEMQAQFGAALKLSGKRGSMLMALIHDKKRYRLAAELQEDERQLKESKVHDAHYRQLQIRALKIERILKKMDDRIKKLLDRVSEKFDAQLASQGLAAAKIRVNTFLMHLLVPTQKQEIEQFYQSAYRAQLTVTPEQTTGLGNQVIASSYGAVIASAEARIKTEREAILSNPRRENVLVNMTGVAEVTAIGAKARKTNERQMMLAQVARNVGRLSDAVNSAISSSTSATMIVC